MGDGGVACVPSQLIMEKFSICVGKTNGNTKLNSSKTSIKVVKVNPKMKPKKLKGSELGTNNFSSSNKEFSERNYSDDFSNDNNKEEVEEGELGTLPFENGEFVPEKPVRRYEIKSEVERGEFFPGKWRKDGGVDKNDWSSSKEDLEKGEFVPDRWCRGDFANKSGEYGYSKARRYDISKEKGWKIEREWTSPSAKERGWRDWSPPSTREKGWKADREWSPPSGKEKAWKGDRDWTSPSSGKYSGEKGSSQNLRRFPSRYEAEKTQKISSKIAGEEGSFKNDFTNSKSHARDYHFSNRLKRHGTDSDTGDRKYRADYDDYSASKSRKVADDGSRSGFSLDHYQGRTAERPYKTGSASSFRNIPSERYSSRHLESSRAAHERHNSSPHHTEHDRARNQYDRSRSPYDRNRHHDNRGRSPMYVEASPRTHARNREGRDRTPTERSPRGRYTDRKAEKRTNHYGSKGHEGKHNLMKDPGGRESEFLVKKSPDRGNVSNDKTVPEEHSQSPSLKNIELSQENGVTEELASMEEDMDICNTPPHVPLVANAVSGKWFYLDHLGVERGPSKLSDLKTLVEEGYLVPDHLIKHVDGDRWVTVERAASPLVTANFLSVVPETVTQLVCPPEAPGNLLADNGNEASGGNEEVWAPSNQLLCSEEKSAASMHTEDLHIDNRVGAILDGVTLVPGKEFEILAGMPLFTYLFICYVVRYQISHLKKNTRTDVSPTDT